MSHRNGNTFLAISTFRPTGMVFGPSSTACLVGNLCQAVDQHDILSAADVHAYAKLARVCCAKSEARRFNQAIAMWAINAASAVIRTRAIAVVMAHAALLATGMTAAKIVAVAHGGEA